ncbi:MAG: transcription termination factor NusA [Calditrichaeota bacterium]|nr:transcription termination factor NusA [Calditrichota bacterium]
MKHEVVDAVSQLLREKGIDKETFQEIIESVFLSMIRRKFGHSDNFSVIFNLEKGDIEIQSIKTIVDDEEMTDPVLEIALSEAHKDDPYAEVGEEIMVMIDYEKEFGRRIISSAKQHLIQRIREIEKDNMFAEFSERLGEIVIGDVHQVTHFDIRINIDKTEVVMPRSEQIYSERYRRGDAIKAIILEVNRTTRDPEIIVSRKDVSFVKRLFELEVPEIYDNIVEIKAIAREAGDRTKIAVESNDKRIDPIGACVGMKGVRIQAIVKELNREKVDIIQWTNDPQLLIRRSLAPVISLDLIFLEGGNKVLAVIPDDQIAQAIGKKGQNIRLASQLTGYDIESVKASEYYQEELYLKDVVELDDELRDLLKEAGYRTAEDVLNTDKETLIETTGAKPETLDIIITILSSYFEETE